jgi:FG-GAP-like repeat
MNSDFIAIPDWFSDANAGAGIAVADLNADGFSDLVVLQVDDSPGTNSAYFRVGFGTDDQLTIGQWTAWSPVPDWDSWFNEGAGVAIADISGNGQPDLLVFRVDAVPEGQNAGYYRIGWDIDVAGQVTGWSPWLAVPDWFPWFNAGADVMVADVDGDGVLDLVVLMVDAPAGRNQGYYHSGPLNADGTVTEWRAWVAVPDWYFWENQGAGIAIADLDGDGTPELVVLAVDSPPEQNGGYYSVGWHLEGGRPI